MLHRPLWAPRPHFDSQCFRIYWFKFLLGRSNDCIFVVFLSTKNGFFFVRFLRKWFLRFVSCISGWNSTSFVQHCEKTQLQNILLTCDSAYYIIFSISTSFYVCVGLHKLFLGSLLPSQVFQIAAQLVYWGKAIIVYPLCENNVYMLSPHANIFLWVSLASAFFDPL